ncbi:MAG: DNA N-6-adenine-methyltransferase, partial [Thermoplasmata archaeon]
PPEMMAYLNSKFGPFTLDPSPYPRPPGYDGLTVRWTGRTFVNPPYGLGIRDWVAKAYESVESGTAQIVVMLLPARTDTQWFQTFAPRAFAVLISGRVRYRRPDGSSAPAPFPSCLLVFANGIRHEIAVGTIPGAGRL